jgi:DNA polymerase-3 subunit epsilon
MRDLGLVKTQSFNEDYEPRFGDRDEAREHYYFATRLKRLEKARVDETARLAEEVAEWPEANFPGSARLRDELAYRLGRKAERAGDTERAFALYGRGESVECSERIIRMLLAGKRRDEARRYLERCLDEPRSDEEWLLAEDLYSRKFESKRTSAATDVLRAAESIEIDESRSGAPENAVVDYFESRGQAAYRTENLVWRTLFGLLFWEELFVDGDVSLHSPFEFLPASLEDGSFYARNRQRIDTKLELLREPGSVKRQLLRTSTARYGTPNGVFRWRESMNDAVFALLDNAPAAAVESILRRLCTEYTGSRYGYPDVMVVDTKGVRFVEVKAEGDQLRRNQLLRLRQLRDAGFRADVLRVDWVIDPEQEYVVVDVETTGGRGEHHRVTEIGAVRVRDGRIVDRFQTLLNPQRSIPANIQRLTGISPAMVAEAPYFSDIADDFQAFLQDAIFVAHNVEFDYGFITREFARLGTRFRLPKLCTCASMRKLYPGQRSYSLASLCRSFDIPLRQHHRALCDAEAAAELLFLVNEKRRRVPRATQARDA